MIVHMDPELVELFEKQGGVATSGQILARTTRRRFEAAINCGVLERMWQGIYCLGEPTDELRLRGLDLSSGQTVPVCLGTAAATYGFDTDGTVDLHVLNPPGGQTFRFSGRICLCARRNKYPALTTQPLPSS